MTKLCNYIRLVENYSNEYKATTNWKLYTTRVTLVEKNTGQNYIVRLNTRQPLKSSQFIMRLNSNYARISSRACAQDKRDQRGRCATRLITKLYPQRNSQAPTDKQNAVVENICLRESPEQWRRVQTVLDQRAGGTSPLFLVSILKKEVFKSKKNWLSPD